MSDRHYISLYFDNAEQKQAFRLEAARRGVSMAELAKQIVFDALFLHELSDSEGVQPINRAKLAA